MGPFALAVPAWRLGQRQPRKRKRGDDNTDKDGESVYEPGTTPTPPASHLSLDIINPRSHSPDTLRQFAVAGLSPEEENPSDRYPNFPHQGIPSDWRSSVASSRNSGRSKRRASAMAAETSGSEADVDTDVESRRQQPSRRPDEQEIEETVKHLSERMRHMGTMMAILHRCLHEGDMGRAKRAFGLLVQTKEVDLRISDMWTLGTEILMREGEQERIEMESRQREQDGVGEETLNATAAGAVPAARPPPTRWGHADNMDKVRDYLENLSRQYPYSPLHSSLPSAIDFWPALFNIEIYNIDAEHRDALRQIAKQQGEHAGDPESDPPISPAGESDARAERRRRGSGGDGNGQDGEEETAAHWDAARDEIRQTTRAAARQIADRMDLLMEYPPYSTHVELLRLRGMLALWLGDLHLPSRIIERRGVSGGLERSLLAEGRGPRKRLEDDLGREKLRARESEFDKARHYFQRMREKGGELESWLQKFIDSDERASSDQGSVND